MTPIERAAEALGNPGIRGMCDRRCGCEDCTVLTHDAALAVFASIDPDGIAQALADDWNPNRDPILTAMFRDYAQTVIAHLTGRDQT